MAQDVDDHRVAHAPRADLDSLFGYFSKVRVSSRSSSSATPRFSQQPRRDAYFVFEYRSASIRCWVP